MFEGMRSDGNVFSMQLFFIKPIELYRLGG